jgi:hypothetical protein
VEPGDSGTVGPPRPMIGYETHLPLHSDAGRLGTIFNRQATPQSSRQQAKA